MFANIEQASWFADVPDDEADNNTYFRCGDGRLIPRALQCDFKVDCLDGEDEKNCGGK